MKKKQMLANLVMLSLLQGSVYAETVDNTLSQGEYTYSGDTNLNGGAAVPQDGNLEITVNDGNLSFDNGGLNLNFGNETSAALTANNVIFNGSDGIKLGSNTELTINADKVTFANSSTGIDRSGGGQNLHFTGDVNFTGKFDDQAWCGRSNGDYNVNIDGTLSFTDIEATLALHDWHLNLKTPKILIKNGTFNSSGLTSALLIISSTVNGADNGQGGNELSEIEINNIKGATAGSRLGNFFGSYFETATINANIDIDGVYNSDNYGGVVGIEPSTEAIINSDRITVNDVHGSGSNVAAYGMWIASDSKERYGATTVTTDYLGITKIISDNNQAFGLFLDDVNSKGETGKETVTAERLNVDNVQGTGAAGIYLQNGGTIKNSNINVTGITGTDTEAIGIQSMNSFIDSSNEGIYISNITGKINGFGLAVLGGNISTNTLSISDVKSESNKNGRITLIDAIGTEITADKIQLTPMKFTDNIVYSGYYGDDADSEKTFINTISIRSTQGSDLKFDENNENQNLIVGTIVAGAGEKDSTNGGKINIGGATTQIYGDVFAGNGGTINITLDGTNSVLEGQVDDYHELVNEDMKGKVFRNSAFVDSEGNPLAVEDAGKATLNINNGGEWIARGQSFVDTVTLNGGIIDMSRNENSSVTVKNLNGKGGKFKMRLDTGDHGNSDMLYVTGTFEGTYELDIIGNEFVASEITEDNPLRFATIKGDVNTENMKARVADAGFFNNTYNITTEDFDKNHRENEDYNGEDNGDDSYKPGNDAVLSMFDNGDTNLLITNEGKQSTVSDAGKTIINMSRANYSNAIYMDRLNKRMGETRYINPEEEQGMWVRLRHDRIGKTDAFRSQNTMYEMGYDVKQDCGNGERRIGMAIDYMDGKTEYRNVAGDGDIKRYGLWLYDTWTGDKGHYTDFVAKWGHLENDFEIYNSRGKVNGDYSNNVFSVSAEYGKKNDMGKGWYFEPQAQLQLARVTGADYVTSQNTKVSLDGINSLIGRAGFRLGRDLNENSTVYVKADLLHEFLGDQTISAYDITTDGVYRETFENKGTWYDVGFGFATALGKNSYAFMDFEKSFGNDNDETYQVNAGVQWTF